MTTTITPGPFTISGHPVYRFAATPNAVALYIGRDVRAPGGFIDPTTIAGQAWALKPGESRTFPLLFDAGEVTVTRSR